MLSGKKPVQAAVSFAFFFYHNYLSFALCSSSFLPYDSQPPSKKGTSAKSGTSKKGDGTSQLKASKSVEVEDVEVMTVILF